MQRKKLVFTKYLYLKLCLIFWEFRLFYYVLTFMQNFIYILMILASHHEVNISVSTLFTSINALSLIFITLSKFNFKLYNHTHKYTYIKVCWKVLDCSKKQFLFKSNVYSFHKILESESVQELFIMYLNIQAWLYTYIYR